MQREGPIGRQHELEEVDAFLDAVAGGLRQLSIIGPAGIGKTTIWREAVHRGRERGYLVLMARPAEAEARLSFAGLADLLRQVGQGDLDSLPGLQRRAIDAALLRTDAGSSRSDGRVVSAAMLSLLHQLTQKSHVLLAIDDAQWLDEETGKALTYAVRRLEGSSIGLLASIRTDDEAENTFESGVRSDHIDQVRIGPMSTAGLHEVVKRHLGHIFPRPTLVRIVAASGGNPFYALEIARELDRTGIPAAGTRLLVPGKLRALVASRVARLPVRTQEALLVAACMFEPTVGVVGEAAIGPAEEAGMVRVDDGGRIRFAHSLFASAVYESASRSRRLKVHRNLAERVDNADERARHLGLAATGPDEAVALALDAAAERAAARGASSAAAALERRALELTEDPHGEVGTRRALALARHVLGAGEGPAEARTVLEGRLRSSNSARLSAELHLQLARVCWDEGEPDSGYAHLVAALERADESELAARVHTEAAWFSEAEPIRAIRHCDAVLDLLDPAVNPGLYSQALLLGAYLRLTTGQGADNEAVDRGRRLQATLGVEDASPVLPLWPALHDDFDLARVLHEELLAGSRMIGAEGLTQSMLGHLVELECWAGDWPRADALAAEAQLLAERIASSTLLPLTLFARGYLDAHMGRTEQARAAGEAILQMTTFASSGLRDVRGNHLLGFIAMSLQEFSKADSHFSRAAAILDRIGYREPARFRFQPDHVEAVIACGDLNRAALLIEQLDERARIFPRPWILATSARCRGLLLSARGRLDESVNAMHSALEHHDQLAMPFERARTLLVLGQLLRRRKERALARARLEDALAIFERLGAPLWADRARDELARIPIRRASLELTSTEEKIARLASTGLTNRSIAERAFVSPKTVEANLARVYDKLGIRSRAELGRVMATREPRQG